MPRYSAVSVLFGAALSGYAILSPQPGISESSSSCPPGYDISYRYPAQWVDLDLVGYDYQGGGPWKLTVKFVSEWVPDYLSMDYERQVEFDNEIDAKSAYRTYLELLSGGGGTVIICHSEEYMPEVALRFSREITPLRLPRDIVDLLKNGDFFVIHGNDQCGVRKDDRDRDHLYLWVTCRQPDGTEILGYKQWTIGSETSRSFQSGDRDQYKKKLDEALAKARQKNQVVVIAEMDGSFPEGDLGPFQIVESEQVFWDSITDPTAVSKRYPPSRQRRFKDDLAF